MSAFDKMLHKDNKKLNRLQKQARNYLETGSNFDPEESKMSQISDKPWDTRSVGSLPALTSKRGLGALNSARKGAAAA